MKCSLCSGKLDIIDSRPVPGLNSRRRRRVCLSCGHLSTSYEITAEDFARLKQLPRDAITTFPPLFPQFKEPS